MSAVNVKAEEKVLPSALETVDVDKLRVLTKVKNKYGKDEEAFILFPMHVGELRAAFAEKLKLRFDVTEEEFVLLLGSMRFRRSSHVLGVVIYQEMKSGRLIAINPEFMKKVEAVSLKIEPCTTRFGGVHEGPFISKVAPKREMIGAGT